METRPWDYYHQRILNAHEIPPRDQQIDLHPEGPVRARIVWEKDGVEFIDAKAFAHAGQLILVQLADKRNRTIAAWLHVSDAPKSSPQP